MNTHPGCNGHRHQPGCPHPKAPHNQSRTTPIPGQFGTYTPEVTMSASTEDRFPAHSYASPQNARLTVPVPAGYVHIEEARELWPTGTLSLIDDNDRVRIEDASNGISPWCISAEAVERVMAEPDFEERLAKQNGEQARAVERDAVEQEDRRRERLEAEDARLAIVIPRRDEAYRQSECVGTAYLKSRGWTDTHIKRLLDTPDAFGVGTYGAIHLWSRERMELAEQVDEKLRKRIEATRAKQVASKTAAVEATMETGKAVFARTPDGAWGIRGRGLTAGQTVEVQRKDGSVEEKVVGSIVSTNTDGTVVAALARTPHEQRDPAATAGQGSRSGSSGTAAPPARQQYSEAPIKIKRSGTDFFGHHQGFGELESDTPTFRTKYTDPATGRQIDGIVTIVASTDERVYDDDNDKTKTVRTGHARLATPEEAAPVIAREEKAQRLAAAAESRARAERSFREVPTEPVEATPNGRVVETVRLNPDSARDGGRHTQYTDADIYADGSVVTHHHDGDNSQSWKASGLMRVTRDPKAADLARQAAHRRFSADGTELPLLDFEAQSLRDAETASDEFHRTVAQHGDNLRGIGPDDQE